MTVWLQSKTTIPTLQGVTEDQVVLTFAWIDPASSGDGVSQSQLIFNRIGSYLNELNGTGHAIRWASYLNMPQTTTEVYNMLHDRPRLPIFEDVHDGLGLPQTTGYDLPSEVAVVVTYSAAPASGANPRRRRGRHYFGPMQLFGTGQDIRWVPSAYVTSVGTAFGYIAGGAAPFLAVYSRYTHGQIPVGGRPPDGQMPEFPESLPSSFSTVASYYVDNAWDTQRRRGHDATARSHFQLGGQPGPARASTLPADAME